MRYATILFCAACFSALVYADTATIDGLTWSYAGNDDNTLTITGVIPREGCIKVPQEIGGRIVKRIGANAFSDSDITEVKIPDGVECIERSAFANCANLIRISIPDSVNEILIDAFSSCNEQLYNTSMISGAKLVDGWAVGNTGELSGCLDLTGVRGIGSYAFSGCGITDVIIPGTVEFIGEWAFSECALTNVTILDGVRSIGFRSFAHCSNLTNVFIPSSVREIGVQSFNSCRALAEMHIPDGVASIGSRAFGNCYSLTNVTIPASVEYIGEWPFYQCNENLYDTNTVVGIRLVDGWAFDDIYNTTEFTGVLDLTGIRGIGDYAFDGCRNVTSVKIPEGVVHIGLGAFKNCTKLSRVDLPNSLRSIGAFAFYGCTRMSSLEIPNGVTNMGEYAFCGCNSIVHLTISDSLSAIPPFAFYGCSNLAGVIIPSSVVRIGGGAFCSCDSLGYVRMLGNAPACSESQGISGLGYGHYNPFAGIFNKPSIETFYVSYGSTGWDGNPSSAALPAKWNDCDIKYAFEVRSFRGVYDGYPHGITIDWGDYIPNEARVMYASNKDGPYAETPITYTDIGEYVVWSVVEESGCAWTNSATVTILGNVARLEKTLVPDSFVYDGTAHEPTVVLKDLNALPNLNVTAYAPGDVDGDGVLSQNDVVLIQRYNAYQALSDAMKEKFPSYNLTGAALAAADVNQDGIVNADDVTTLNGKFSGYELVEGSDYTLAYSDNVNVGTGKVTITGKGNYGGMAILEFTIAKATIGADGEPGSGTVPDGGVSKFDASFVYDGEGHTINTNALTAAFGNVMVGASSIEYAVDDGTGESPVLPWLETAPVYTNVGEYVVWYRVTNPNYNEFVNAAKLSITKRPVTVTSADGSWTYDGHAHSNATVTCEGFVDGEGIVANNFATITDVGSAANAFTYVFADGTLAENYVVTCVTGTLTISEAYKAFVIRCEWTEDMIRPATMDFMVLTNGAAWQIEAVAAVDGWKKKTDVKVYNQGVPIEYELVALPVEGIRSEIEKLGCRTVGSLSGLDNVLTESGWNNVGSSTMNTVVGTVDGWRRFGELRMSDLVIAEDTSKGVFFKVCNFKSTFDIDDGTDGTGGEASRFSYSGVYDGVGHGIGVEVANAPSGMTVKYARGNAGTPPSDGWSAVNPLFTNVCDRAVVWYAVESAGYVSYTNSATVTIMPKTLTDEMVVLTDKAFFYDPGSTVKKPSVTVSDTNAVGVVISTVDDYTVVYDEATSAGAIPVTVTGKNNYTGTVTKTFDVLKRPVEPPVIGTKAYNGRKQKATVPVDDRWTVVKNDGGINVGEYEVVLRLTNPNDYRWKGVDEAEAEWTGVFRITKANNGWSRYPGILGWSIDEEPNDPTGQSRWGTLSVAYRKAGTEVATETSVKPSEPGDYIARFWVEGTENYIGVALTVHYEVAFTITASDGIPSEETQTTPVPVPHVWLEKYVNTFGGGDFEKAANSKGANGVSLWESYVAGLDPEDATSRFTAKIEMGADGKAVVTWTPDLSNAEKPRKYTTLGKKKLGDDAWSPVTDDNKAKMRFFKVTVEMK